MNASPGQRPKALHGRAMDCVLISIRQSQKYLLSAQALLAGKLLRVWKVFARRLNLQSTAKIFIQHFRKTFQFIWKLFRLSGRFLVNLEGLHSVWKLSRLLGKFSRLSGNFPGYLESFQFISKVQNLSGKFPEKVNDFQPIFTLWKVFRLS